MKAARFDYARPASLAEALAMLAKADGGAKLMAGGQSLGPMLNLRLARPELVVDIAGLADLHGVVATDAGIAIGAGVTHAAIEDGRHPPLRGHPVQAVAAGIAYRAIRNRGTVGGSLAHADPAADWVVAMTALGATLQIASPAGDRRVALDAFVQGAYTTALAAGEILTRIDLPPFAADARWGYYKFCRKPGEFAEASAAVLFAASSRTARIVLGALDGPPCALPALAAAVAREGPVAAGRDAVLAAVRAVRPDRDPVDCQLHAIAVERALALAGLAPPAADRRRPSGSIQGVAS